MTSPTAKPDRATGSIVLKAPRRLPPGEARAYAKAILAAVADLEKPPPDQVAAEITALRVSLGLTQDEFADKLHVGRVTVWRWERGISTPRRKAMANIRRMRSQWHRRQAGAVRDGTPEPADEPPAAQHDGGSPAPMNASGLGPLG